MNQYIAVKWSNYENFVSQCNFDEQLTDVSLICEEQILKSHRNILSIVSPFFNMILKDINPPQYPVIIITDLKFQEINAIMQFIYNGETVVEANRLNDLVKAAEKLQIKALIEGMNDYFPRKRKSRAKKRENHLFNQNQNVYNSNHNHNDNDNENQNENSFVKRNSKRLTSKKSDLKVKNDDWKGKNSKFKKTITNKNSNTKKKKVNKKNKQKEEQANSVRQLVVISEGTNLENAQITIDPSTSTATIASASEDGITATTTVPAVKVLPIIDTILVDTPTPTACNICGILCQNETVKRGHIKLHDRDFNQRLPKYINEKRNKNKYNKPHPCPYCPYSSEHPTNLLHHIRTHTGEKPHRCQDCGRCFSRKETLNHHMRSHTGERPFQCDVCNKKFLFKHNLTSHFNVHSDKKKYSCSFCDKSFSMKTSLKKHLKLHQKETYESGIINNDNQNVIIDNSLIANLITD